MAFTDLPDDWSSRPLREPRLIADVLDRLLCEADRRATTLLVVLCDDDARMVQPVVIDDLPADDEDGVVTETLTSFFGLLAKEGMPSTVLVALGRPGLPATTPGDLAWRSATEKSCGTGVTLLGFHVATPAGHRCIT